MHASLILQWRRSEASLNLYIHVQYGFRFLLQIRAARAGVL